MEKKRGSKQKTQPPGFHPQSPVFIRRLRLCVELALSHHGERGWSCSILDMPCNEQKLSAQHANVHLHVDTEHVAPPCPSMSTSFLLRSSNHIRQLTTSQNNSHLVSNLPAFSLAGQLQLFAPSRFGLAGGFPKHETEETQER